MSAKNIETIGTTTIDWGDGSLPDGGDAGSVTCHAHTPLAPLSETYELPHTYPQPGSYTVTFTTTYCAREAPAGSTEVPPT